MKEIRKYEAYDGTIFDKAESCKNYEEESLEGLESSGEISFYEEDLKPYKEVNILKKVESAPVIYIKTRRAYEVLRSVSEVLEIKTPVSPGFWYFDTEVLDWVDIQHLIKQKKADYSSFMSRYANTIGKEIII